MKKFFGILVIVLIIGGGVWYAKKAHAPIVPEETHTTTYSNPATGISFTYPKILTASTTKGVTTLHHEVAFPHRNFCDFKGEDGATRPMLTDFNVTIRLINKNLIDTMREESPYIPAENFVDGEVVVSPGFIDSVTYGNLRGYKIFEGAEGCGQITYYFPIDSERTLVANQEFITIFSGSYAIEEGKQASKVPGVINREKEAEIIESILSSLSVK